MAAMLKLVRRPRDESERRARQADDEKIVSEITQRFQYLLTVWRPWGVECQEIADYTLPRKNSIIVQRVPGTKRTQRLFDATAPSARDKFAAAIHGGLTSSYLRWFFLETDSEELNADQATAIWLDQVGSQMLAEFNRSNFSQEIDEAFIDLCTFANSCTLMEEKPSKGRGQFGGFQFRTEQCGRFVWAEGPDGMVNCVFRELLMTRAAILADPRWRDTPPSAFPTENKDEQLSVIHACEPDEDAKNWTSTYVLTEGKYLLSRKQYREFPYLCARWSKASGETYGRGPTHRALPFIRSLNKLVEMKLRALPKIIDPPLVAVNGDVIGPARMVPGGVTNVRGSRESIGPLQSGIDLRQAEMSEEGLRTEIRDIYHENELQLQTGPQMTAYEAAQRVQQMQMLLGPTLGRLEKEALHPLISRAFNLMKRAAVLPPLPAALRAAVLSKKVQLRVRYDGPIARAQRASDVDSMSRLFTFAQPIIEMDPAAADVIDSDEVIRVAARKLGVPPQIIRDKGQADQLRTIKAQQAQQQQKAAQFQQTAQAAGAAAPMVKAAQKKPEPGSPLAALAQNTGPVRAAA